MKTTFALILATLTAAPALAGGNVSHCDDGSVWVTGPGRNVYRNGELLHRQAGRDGLVDGRNIAYVFGGPLGAGFRFWVYDSNRSDTLLAGSLACRWN